MSSNAQSAELRDVIASFKASQDSARDTNNALLKELREISLSSNNIVTKLTVLESIDSRISNLSLQMKDDSVKVLNSQRASDKDLVLRSDLQTNLLQTLRSDILSFKSSLELTALRVENQGQVLSDTHLALQAIEGVERSERQAKSELYTAFTTAREKITPLLKAMEPLLEEIKKSTKVSQESIKVTQESINIIKDANNANTNTNLYGGYMSFDGQAGYSGSSQTNEVGF
ncbi:hypothetical protein ONZ45_g16514 [Pleurotus djamor]|nr:hypothetical protein ONZ45_g16514 [Pleurotus djamor]